jgi:hypothetical protein
MTGSAVTWRAQASWLDDRLGGRGAGSGQGSWAVGENSRPVPLSRIAWLVTVAICVIATVILLLSGYDGYAGVVFAVAVAAAINLR